MKALYSITLLILAIVNNSLSQCPTVDFLLPSSPCKDQQFSPINNSVNTVQYEWDFCTGDFESIPLATSVLTSNSLNSIYSTTIIKEKGNWYSFSVASSSSIKKLLKVSFGDSLINSPTIEDLGNLGGLLTNPRAIDMIKENDIWYALIVNFDSNIIIKVSFPNGPNNAPIYESIGVISGLSGPISIKLVRDQGNLHGFICNNAGNNLSRLDFGTSITNTPTVQNISIAGAVNLRAISFNKYCNNWFGIASSYGNNRIYKLSFTSLLSNTPTVTQVTSPGVTFSQPTYLSLVIDNSNYYAIIQSRGGDLYRLNFGNDMSSNTPSGTNWGKLGNLLNQYSLSIVKVNSTWYGITTDYVNNKLYRLDFPSLCSSVLQTSKGNTTSSTYTQSGSYNISLIGYSADGSILSKTKTLTVTTSEASKVDFSFNKECKDVNTEFTGSLITGSNISTWKWDFGDPSTGVNNISNVQNPSHQFSSAGVYKVKLDVQNVDGCNNFIEKNVTIYNSTNVDFDFPSGTICTGRTLNLINMSTGEIDNVTWNWEFIKVSDGTVVSTSNLKNPAFQPPSAGNFKIRLTAGVSGCESSIEKSFSVEQGPAPDFNYSNNCGTNSIVYFNNLSNNITKSTWEIRKADNTLITSSESTNFSFQFISEGSYNIVLKVENSLGCESSLSKSVIVSNLNKADILESGFTENMEGTLTGGDLTGSDDEVLTWTWDLGGLSTANGKIVKMTFPEPKEYLVRLTITTFQGCLQTIEKTIAVKEATCPVADFTIPEFVCLAEQLPFKNNTLNGNEFLWDFCSGDLAQAPTATALNVPSVNSASGINIVKEGANWYGFMASTGNNKIVRLDFGSNLESIPSIVDLGNINASLVSPESIKMIKEGENWYGLITNGAPKNLTRLSFGKDITNQTPIIENLIVLNSGRGDMTVLKEADKLIVVVANSITNKLNIINFHTSITTNPTSSDTLSSDKIIGITALKDVSIIKECNKWVGVAIGYNSRTFHKVDFGVSLFSKPTFSSIQDLGPLPVENTVASAIELIEEGGNIYGLVLGYSTGKIYRINFGNSISNVPTLTDLGNLGALDNAYSLAIVNEDSKWHAFTNNAVSNRNYRISFPNPCSTNKVISNEYLPEISYSAEGTYLITLTAKDKKDGKSTISKSINIRNSQAPQATFTSGNNCKNSLVVYTPTILNQHTITNWSWNFGDPASGSNNTSDLQTPSHQYAQPGIYNVRLFIVSDNGCSNTITRRDTIYDETQPNFSEQSGLLCSSGPILFTNTSTKETGPKVKWLWDFGDGQTSTEKEPTHTYANGGTYTVTLMAGVEGCSNTFSKDIEVIQGPNTNFSFQNHCLGETTQFTNETIGDNITAFEWDFGDGNTSTVWSPQHTYTAIGKYDVVLKVSNINGCEVSKTIEVQIHDLPVVDFTPSALLCSADSLQFIDNSTLSDGNITQWVWTISNEQLAINNQFFGKDAKLYFPEPGDYKVTLTATSEAGCSTSTTKNLNILKSPEIRFDASNLCVGDSAVLQGVSQLENQNIVAWSWQISDGGMDEGQNIKHKFTSPGTYIIYLTAISENSCPKTIVKEVTVYSKPVAKFGSTNNCLNAPVQFSDSSTVDGDVITSWNWKIFNEQLTMINEQSAQHPQFTFNATGNYQVELTVTTSHGCSSMIRKTVTINLLPVADFTFEPEVGPPPFQVQFQNTTTGGATYFWDFGNGDTSTEAAPQYTYNSLGTYDVTLIAFNAFGCNDTIVKKLRVAPPVTSVAMEKILVSTLTEELAFATELTNTGSRIVRNIEFIIDFGGNLSFKESWSGVLNPDEKMTYSIKTQLLKDQLSKVKYICITAVELNNEPFDFQTNNVCINLTDQFFVFNPQPNPANDIVTFSYVLPEDKPLEINFYSTSGQKITMNMPQYSQGYNQSSFSISAFAQGMYYVEFVYGGQRTKKKLVVY